MTLNRDVLLVPMQPTPNGALHVGHAAGTYLRTDAVARALAVRGHRVSVVTGSDAFENWVPAAALAEGTTPEEVCRRYHADNERDLRALGVQLDAWIDPRSPEHYPAYRQVHEDTLLSLSATGGAGLETELVPHTSSGEPALGAWIAGRCPHCNSPAAGSTCPACGEHFQPEELLAPTSRLDHRPLQWRPVTSWFARPRDPEPIVAQLAADLRPVFVDAAIRYLHGPPGGRVRLSAPGSWGIISDLIGRGGVLANAYYLYAVHCGEVYRSLYGRADNPFTGGGASTVGIFGHDNATPGLVAPHVLAQASAGALAPFDRVIVHGMLTFGGQKCSTSKRHGLWLGDLFAGTLISSDELRFVLAYPDLDRGTADLTLPELADTVTGYRRWAAATLPAATDQVRTAPTADPAPLLRLVDEQHRYLDPGRLDLPAASGVLHDWMHATDQPAGQWLLGLALLGEPIIPDLARAAWAQLGLPGPPTLHAAASARPVPRVGNVFPRLPTVPLTSSDLQPLTRTAPADPAGSEPANSTTPTTTVRYR